MANTALFQRKGAPQTSESSEANTGPGDQSGPSAETGEEGGTEMCVCPQCGCEFDPDNPAAYAAPQGDMGGSMGGAPPMGGAGDIAAMLGVQ